MQKAKASSTDRFIPLRKAQQSLYFSPERKKQSTEDHNTHLSHYVKMMASYSARRHLVFSAKSDFSVTCKESLSQFIEDSKTTLKIGANTKVSKKVTAFKVMDAPCVLNSFYASLMDYSAQQAVAVGLNDKLFIQSANADIVQMDRSSSSIVHSVKFEPQGNMLLVGEETGRLEVYDVTTQTLVRQIKSHYNRISTLCTIDSHCAISGSKDRMIIFYDIRVKNAVIQSLERHKGQVCGLAIQDNNLASGGNDNKVCVWDLRVNKLSNLLNYHQSAVKALSWCPWRSHLLASGGGSLDKRIFFWNGNTGSVESCVQMKSPVTSIHWRPGVQDIFTTHGTIDKDGIGLVWGTTDKKIKQRLEGHEGRILCGALNPKNLNIACTLGSDETFRFWKLAQATNYKSSSSRGTSRQCQTRFR